MGFLYVSFPAFALAFRPCSPSSSSPAPLLVPRRAPPHQLPLADRARPAFHTRGERSPRECAAPRRTSLGEALSPCLDYLHVLRPGHCWHNVRHRDEPEELIQGPRAILLCIVISFLSLRLKSPVSMYHYQSSVFSGPTNDLVAVFCSPPIIK